MVAPFQKVLVPLDGSDRAELALAWALAVVQRADGEIILMQALPAPVTRFEGEAYLSALSAKVGTTGTPIRTRVVEGDAAEMILRAAGEEGATCVAMSTHGRSGIARWLLGSVAEKVIRAIDRPVVVVPTREPYSEGTRIVSPIRKILVPTDGSGHSLEVLPWAIETARTFGAELILIHSAGGGILVPPAGALAGPYAVPGFPPVDPKPAERVAERIAIRYQTQGVRIVPVDTVGDAASEIVDHATSLGVDLVALSTHGRTGSARWMLGSVTEKVIRALSVPAMVIRPAGLSPSLEHPS